MSSDLGKWMVAAVTLFGAAGVQAAEEWKPMGLEGEHVWALAASPSGVVLAGTVSDDGGSGPGHVYRLEDGGTWSDLWTFAAGVWELEFDPDDESIVYAGLNGGGVYRSLDGGESWSWSNLDGQIWDIAVSASDSDVLYVASQSGGIYKSVDAGTSWQGLAVLGDANAVAIDPLDPDVVLAGSPFDAEGIFRTVDGGQTWSNVKLGSIRSLHFDSQNASIVYAGESADGVFKSLDSGETWFKVDPGLFAHVAWIRQSDGTLYITDAFESGVPAYRSADGGQSWEPLPRQLPDPFYPRSLAVAGETILIGTTYSPGGHPGGVYRWGQDDPQDLAAELIAEVIALNLENGVSNGLDQKLDAVLASLEDLNENNDVAAIGSLGAFINAVEAQRGKKISDADADALIAAAQEIIDLLEEI